MYASVLGIIYGEVLEFPNIEAINARKIAKNEKTVIQKMNDAIIKEYCIK